MAGKPREGRERRERAPVVVGHGGLTSDSGGNGGALRIRRRTASTLTLRLSGEVDELWRKKMESWASWSEH